MENLNVAKYFTHEKSYYSVPHTSAEFSNVNFIHISYFQGADFNQYNFKNVSSCFELSDVQINAVIVYSNLSIETSFPCIPTT